MIELDQDNLGEHIKSNELVFVQFGATWCGNCRMIKPKIKKYASEHENITFVYADAEKFPGAREFATVDNLPTYAIYKSGELVKQAQGNKLEIIEGLINEITGN